VRGPGRTSTRLAGVDVARGLALLGMAAVHIFPEQSADGGLHPAYVVAAGRASALFAVLAGVGLALLRRSGRGCPHLTDLAPERGLPRSLEDRIAIGCR